MHAVPAAAPSVGVAPPPYSLDPVACALPALADAAGSVATPADRDLALAALLVARLMAATIPPIALPPGERAVRTERARQWVLSLPVPQPARLAFLRAVDVSVAGGREGAATLRELAQMLHGHLPSAALHELGALGEALLLYYEQTP